MPKQSLFLWMLIAAFLGACNNQPTFPEEETTNPTKTNAAQPGEVMVYPLEPTVFLYHIQGVGLVESLTDQVVSIANGGCWKNCTYKPSKEWQKRH